MKKFLLLFVSVVLWNGCTNEAKMKTSVSTNKQDSSLDLVNNRWVLRELNGVAVKPFETKGDIYIRFKDSTSVEGYGGCNHLMGTYKNTETTFKIGPLAMTRMMCPNDSIEFVFSQALEQSNSYTTDLKFLYLKKEEAVVAKLEAVAL